ncbi:helix-turn-helix domain-containing protein [uncultured Sphingomonas sp.]|uniref:helix-turn-helix domain-containing protein n=1 Tax=uncultured Sphingomonas sp. TaxID=158754 RepID=UPI0025EA2A64|nr:helix-turn-helix domain-containing protein [uncultured Sphingomonas sp.]
MVLYSSGYIFPAVINSDRVRARMDAVGLTQSGLARRVGVTQGAIAKIAKNNPNGSSYLHKIAQVLQTTPAYLTGETDDPDQDAPPPPPPAVITARLEVTLGSEDALALMFEGLLAGLDRDAPRASQARLLAQKLPIALSSLRDLRVVSEPRRDRSEVSPEADERLATASPAPRP